MAQLEKTVGHLGGGDLVAEVDCWQKVGVCGMERLGFIGYTHFVCSQLQDQEGSVTGSLQLLSAGFPHGLYILK